ncbi:MAG: glutaredoxin 3 [Gammaproteobacteria bacterium]|nr:glutaredoxin 3 [Gammaproteobacteria bacterium]
MAQVTIYSRSWCSFCHQAKSVLQQKDIEFDVIDIELQPKKREEMITLTGRTSVPQIFINQQPIGGCDDLMALNASGELDNLLKA